MGRGQVMSTKVSYMIDALVEELEREEANAKPVAKARAQQLLMSQLTAYRIDWEEREDENT